MKEYVCTGHGCDSGPCTLSTNLPIFPDCPGGLNSKRDWKERAAKVSGAPAEQTGNSAMDAIALCRGLVNWYDRRNVTLGQNFTDIIERARAIVQQHQPAAPNLPSAPLEYDEWSARPCSNYDRCPVKNKNLHCYANKPCFE